METAGATRIDAVLPGRLLAHALPRTAGGGRAVLLLVAREDNPDGPRELHRLDLERRELTVVLDNLPAKADALETVSVGGAEIVLLGQPWTVYRVKDALGDRPVLERLVNAPGLELGARPRTAPGIADDGDAVALAAVGELLLFERGERRQRRELALPVDAHRRRSGLILTTPKVAALPADGGDSRYAAGPEAAGPRRLRTVLIDSRTTDGDGDERGGERWSLLPGPEQVHESWYLPDASGRAYLVVTTTNAEKMVILGHKRLRLFPLLPDRTRAGKGPAVTAELGARIWQRVWLSARDADGDGNRDLALIQRAGLGDGKLRIDLFRGRAQRGWESTPRTTMIEERLLDPAYGDDLDGDGDADLVARAGRRLVIHPGVLGRSKRDVVAKKPSREIELAAAGEDEGSEAFWRGPDLVDLDGDGHLDAVLTARKDRGRGRLRLVLIRP